MIRLSPMSSVDVTDVLLTFLSLQFVDRGDLLTHHRSHKRPERAAFHLKRLSTLSLCRRIVDQPICALSKSDDGDFIARGVPQIAHG